MGGFSGSPQWSPDGQKVAFDRQQVGHFDIWVADVGQGSPMRLTSGNSDHVRPSWPSDGKWIYFGSDATKLLVDVVGLDLAALIDLRQVVE